MSSTSNQILFFLLTEKIKNNSINIAPNGSTPNQQFYFLSFSNHQSFLPANNVLKTKNQNKIK
jgi:hypothetical protein